MNGPNLARRPFLNLRPVRRVTTLLWVLGVLLTAVSVLFYARHVTGSGAQREQLEELRTRVEAEEARLAELQAELAGLDLEWQNRRATFLNHKIAQRSFSWSDLFDRLGEVLPPEVRLLSLTPRFGAGGRRLASRDAAGLDDREAQLEIRGVARSGEALLALVDGLFEHPSFRDPDLSSELRRPEQGVTEFALTVVYQSPKPKRGKPAEAEGETAETAEGEAEEADEE